MPNRARDEKELLKAAKKALSHKSWKKDPALGGDQVRRASLGSVTRAEYKALRQSGVEALFEDYDMNFEATPAGPSKDRWSLVELYAVEYR